MHPRVTISDTQPGRGLAQVHQNLRIRRRGLSPGWEEILPLHLQGICLFFKRTKQH